jgi:predicted RNase H-like HicB family nuclease
MNTKEPYPYIVYWSEEDGCFIGQCPGLFYGSGATHGDDPEMVFRQLRRIAQEEIEDLLVEGKALPPPPRDWAKAPSVENF